MKISTLVQYIETIQSFRPRGLNDTVRSAMNTVIFEIEKQKNQAPAVLNNLKDNVDVVSKNIVEFDSNIDEILTRLREQIKHMEPAYLAKSYRLYEEGLAQDTDEYILSRSLSLSPTSANFIQSRVQARCNWHYGAAIIRPGREPWIENMVASDPLYVIDTSHALFEHAKSLFNAKYQRRLRYNVIDEYRNPGQLDCLPDDQLGFVLAYNFFHYKPWEVMRAYLEEIWKKLRPGGVLAFTFNDCDRFNAVVMAENGYTCYTPGNLISSLCETLGFDIQQTYEITDETIWMEIQKPGHRASLRGGQSLAEIIAKSK